MNLSEFLNAKPQQVAAPKKTNTTSFHDFESLEYKKINLEMFENHDFLSAKEETETPVIFLETSSDRIKNAKSLKEILESYEQFKAVSNEIAETSVEENFDLRSPSLTKSIMEDEIDYAAEEALET